MGLLSGRKRRSPRRRKRGVFAFLGRFIGPGVTIASVLAAAGTMLSGQFSFWDLDEKGRGGAAELNGPVLASSDLPAGPPEPIGSPPTRPIDAAEARLATNDRAVAPNRSPRSGQLASARRRPAELPRVADHQDRGTVRIASFNIQVFGNKKSSDLKTLQKIAQVVTMFDVVAIQEIRGGDSTAVDRLITEIRRGGGDYASRVSPPIGRTSQTECYAFVWNRRTMELVDGSDYVVSDPQDLMHREPMVASFRTRLSDSTSTAVNPSPRQPFRFTLINVHTDPDEVTASAPLNEMDVLDDVFWSVRQFDFERYGEEDCILLGDLNVDVKGLSELGQLPGIESIIGDEPTNTRLTKTYDHILIDGSVTSEYTGKSGVYDLRTNLAIDLEAALDVSDHNPVWAEFRAFEIPPPPAIAAGRSGVTR